MISPHRHPGRRGRSHRPRLGAIALTAVLLAGAAACGSDDNAASVTTASAGSSATSAGPATTAATPTTGGETASTCVTNVEDTVASAATVASHAPLPADLVATLDAAAQASFQQAAAPGAIVGAPAPALGRLHSDTSRSQAAR